MAMAVEGAANPDNSIVRAPPGDRDRIVKIAAHNIAVFDIPGTRTRRRIGRHLFEWP